MSLAALRLCTLYTTLIILIVFNVKRCTAEEFKDCIMGGDGICHCNGTALCICKGNAPCDCKGATKCHCLNHGDCGCSSSSHCRCDNTDGDCMCGKAQTCDINNSGGVAYCKRWEILNSPACKLLSQSQVYCTPTGEQSSLYSNCPAWQPADDDGIARLSCVSPPEQSDCICVSSQPCLCSGTTSCVCGNSNDCRAENEGYCDCSSSKVCRCYNSESFCACADAERCQIHNSNGDAYCKEGSKTGDKQCDPAKNYPTNGYIRCSHDGRVDEHAPICKGGIAEVTEVLLIVGGVLVGSLMLSCLVVVSRRRRKDNVDDEQEPLAQETEGYMTADEPPVLPQLPNDDVWSEYRKPSDDSAFEG